MGRLLPRKAPQKRIAFGRIGAKSDNPVERGAKKSILRFGPAPDSAGHPARGRVVERVTGPYRIRGHSKTEWSPNQKEHMSGTWSRIAYVNEIGCSDSMLPRSLGSQDTPDETVRQKTFS